MTHQYFIIMKNIILNVVFCLVSILFISCEDELIMTSFVDTAERTPVSDGFNVSVEIPISTINFAIVEAHVELSKHEDMSGAKLYTIEDVIWHGCSETKEYYVTFTNLEPSIQYYYRLVVEGFVGNDNFTAQMSTFTFKKNSFISPSISYTVYTKGFVDMGVSVKWAACNLGAEMPADTGTLAGWGDPTGLLNSTDDEDYGGKYPPSNISGSSLDIVTQKLGSNYRTPTKEQYLELINNCTVRYSEYRGSTGWMVISSKGNAIFFPCTSKDGYVSRYWTATFSTSQNKPVYLGLGKSDYKEDIKAYVDVRSAKGRFRPVCK